VINLIRKWLLRRAEKRLMEAQCYRYMCEEAHERYEVYESYVSRAIDEEREAARRVANLYKQVALS